MTLRVVKVGGSLLARASLGACLQQWLVEQPAATNVLVLGGGPLGDAIRELDSRHDLGERLSHDLCLDVLSTTAVILQRLLPTAMMITDPQPWLDGNARHRSGTWIADPRVFLAAIPNSLPKSWHVTTDSIAAWLAVAIAADELTLLKSSPPPSLDLQVLADSGYVDSYFPIAAAKLNYVRCVDLGAISVLS